MKKPEQYEAEIDSLRSMNLKLQILLTEALETVVENARNAIVLEHPTAEASAGSQTQTTN
jgi:hypothetical protein